MIYTKIDLCSRALVKLGASTIASFDEDTAEAKVCMQLYEPTLESLLASYPWRFALEKVELARLVTAPKADYKYAYQLPNDCVRILSAGNGIKSQGLKYKIVGNTLHTNSEQVMISYIRRPNESEFPPFFCNALIARLSAELCLPLTESTTRTDYMYNRADEEFKMAKLTDSQQDIPACFQDFSLIEVRQ
ncbi:MAG: hypothetical protein II938_04810 [Alphaproteobacteria bacterium]|nr:hypothetical protein [Alphaproteobacteria bacterium]